MISAYWVVDGVLAAGPYPGSVRLRRTKAKLGTLLGWGVRAFVDLTEPEELKNLGALRPYGDTLEGLARDEGLEVCLDRFPIPDMGVSDRAEMRLILDRLDAHRASGITAYVHCLAGKGRTGTVVGCYLATGPSSWARRRATRRAGSPSKPSSGSDARGGYQTPGIRPRPRPRPDWWRRGDPESEDGGGADQSRSLRSTR